MNCKISSIISIFIAFFCFLTTGNLSADVIPAEDQASWGNAGLLSTPPSYADTVFQINLMSGADWDAKLQTALSEAKTYTNDTSNPNRWAIIYFPAGEYDLDDPYELDATYHNIIIQGAGANKTILKFDIQNCNENCFTFYGTENSSADKNYLSAELTKGATTITCSSAISYSTPLWIRLSYENHAYWSLDDWAKGCVGQITRLESKSGNTGTLKDEAYITYPASPSIVSIVPINPIKNIGIENLTIKREETSAATLSGDTGINVNFKYAVNCWVKGVAFEQTCKRHIQARFSSHILISGNYIHNARAFGDGGYGYGVLISESSTNCLIENNVFHRLRHAMLVQAGAMCNVFAFNYSYEQTWTVYNGGPYIPGDWGPPNYFGADLCAHGNYPYSNLFEHNFVERIALDQHHGANGAYNAIVRNRVTNDHDNDACWIYIASTPHASVLGNVYSLNQVPVVDYLSCSSYRDVYGFLSSIGYSHAYFLADLGDESLSTLPDISYYYSSRPSFLSSSYTWPAIGPSVSGGNLTQSIPARDRFSQSDKTYLDAPIPPVLSYEGTLPYDQTWSGTHTCTDDIVVPSGVTLTIEHGATIYFPAGKKLQVYGTLNADGLSTNRVTFRSTSGTWYGIKFESTGDGEIEYCNINYASFGVYANQSSPKVQNCIFNANSYHFNVYYGMNNVFDAFDNNTLNSAGGFYAINLFNPGACVISNCDLTGGTYKGVNANCASVSSSLSNNKIHNFGTTGLNLLNSSPVMIGNLVYDNSGYGIYMTNNSDPELIHDYEPGNNVVAYNGGNGVYISSNCDPILGGLTDGDEEIANSFYDNTTYDLNYNGTA